MSQLQQSDLILAGRYVDGDLPAHEADAAEARIANDADFAAAVEDIRQQSLTLRLLPKFKPSNDLADRTLRASLDQVSAIMGAWPMPSDDEQKVTLANSQHSDRVDWKSTVALIASLAGVLMLGAILWQGSHSSSESDMAMSEAPGLPSASVEEKESFETGDLAVAPNEDALNESVDVVGSLPVPLKESGNELSSKASPEKGGMADRQQVASRSVPAGPGNFGGFSGTPMKRSPADGSMDEQIAMAKGPGPVAQVWCVKQDASISKSAVCDILQQNSFNVQLEEKKSDATDPESVDAFYVAATPGQMKSALSQISDNAMIEMFELPQANSPIADAIQQQFVGESSNQQAGPMKKIQLPERFSESAVSPLAQQLVGNFLPRPVAAAPVPRILKSGMPIAGLNQPANEFAGPPSKNFGTVPSESLPREAAKSAVAQKQADGLAGMGGGGGLGGGRNELDAKHQKAAPVQSANEGSLAPDQSAVPVQRSTKELDKYLDESDQQLRQYLILVRGGGEAAKR